MFSSRARTWAKHSHFDSASFGCALRAQACASSKTVRPSPSCVWEGRPAQCHGAAQDRASKAPHAPTPPPLASQAEPAEPILEIPLLSPPRVPAGPDLRQRVADGSFALWAANQVDFRSPRTLGAALSDDVAVVLDGHNTSAEPGPLVADLVEPGPLLARTGP